MQHPYTLTLPLTLHSGSRHITKEIPFDVFERWDTLHNRDLRPYVDNPEPEDRDPMDRELWERE
jgi:hypothetical protein